MKRQPKLMNFSRMRGILEPYMEHIPEHLFINSELAIVYGDPRIFNLVLQQGPPFAIDDYRLGVIAKGEVRASINLVEKTLSAGTLIFIGPGTIISPVSFSKGLEIYGIGLSARFPMPFPAGQQPSAFNGQVRDFQLRVSEPDILTVRYIIDTIWHMVHQKDYHRQTVSALVAAMMQHYDGLYHQQENQEQNSISREQTIFDRFIYLVNQFSQQEHRVGFYARKMCLSERYLGTVIRQASGTTAKEWIDRALITRIQVELRHTDKSIAQIADEMSFPNPSFFSKYFKRITGVTPLEFRENIVSKQRDDSHPTPS